MARVVLQRGLGLVYLIAFAVALEQFPALCSASAACFRWIGSFARVRFARRRACSTSATRTACWPRWRSQASPCRWPSSSGFPIAGRRCSPSPPGSSSGRSISPSSTSDRRFYSFGWESLLLEAGFLAAFLGPASAPVPALLVWLFRWLLFRLEFGAGLIKMRGDRCWRDLTCLYYHHETQPMPNPLSWYFHHLPEAAAPDRGAGQPLRAAGRSGPALLSRSPSPPSRAWSMAVTQFWLVLSGNFSWLNSLTIVLGASATRRRRLRALPLAPGAGGRGGWHDAVVLAVAALVVVLVLAPRAEPLLARAAHERQLQSAAPREHLRSVRQRSARALRDRRSRAPARSARPPTRCGGSTSSRASPPI